MRLTCTGEHVRAHYTRSFSVMWFKVRGKRSSEARVEQKLFYSYLGSAHCRVSKARISRQTVVHVTSSRWRLWAYKRRFHTLEKRCCHVEICSRAALHLCSTHAVLTCAVFVSSAYKTVSGVNGPLVILDQVKVRGKPPQLFVSASSLLSVSQ